MPFYPHVIIYQNLFEAPFVTPVQVESMVSSPDGPYFPYSFIYRTKTEPVFVPPTTTFTWQDYTTYDDLVFRRGGMHAAYQQPFTIDPFPKVSTAYDQSVNPDFAPDRRLGLAAQLQQAFAYGTLLPIVPAVSYFLTSYNVANDTTHAAYHQPFTTDPFPKVSFSYFNWLSEPVRGKRIAEHKYEFYANFTPAAAFTIYWYNWLAEPVRAKQGLPTSQQQTTAFNPLPFVSFSYFNWLAEPTRAKQIAEHRYEFSPYFTPVTQVLFVASSVDMPGIDYPYSFIYRTKTEPIFVPQISFGYFNALAEPVRSRVFPTSQQQAFATSPFPFVNFSYFNWLSEPTRRVPIAEHKYEFYGNFTPAATFNVFWYNWLSEPVRTKAALLTGQNEAFFFGAYSPIIPSFGYFNWLTEPVRTRNFPTSQQQAFAISPFPFVNFSYFNWLSEPPVKSLRPVPQYQDFTYGAVPITPAFGYFNALSEPVRQLPRVAFHQDLFTSFQVTPAFTTFWFNWLAEPVRTKAALATPNQQAFFIGPYAPIIPSFGYYNWLSEPVRTKPALPTSQHQSFTISPFPRISISFFNWLSEPVRAKAGLLAGLQQVTAYGATPIIPSFGYFNSLALPNALFTKRQPLNTPAFTKPEFTPAFIASAMNLAVTEQGDFFLGILQTFKVPIKALVDIITFSPYLRPGVGPAVATQSPQRNISAIIEPKTVQQAGIVPPAVGGRVAIVVFKP